MIQVGEEISKTLQFDMVKSLINADTESIDKNIPESLFQILHMM